MCQSVEYIIASDSDLKMPLNVQTDCSLKALEPADSWITKASCPRRVRAIEISSAICFKLLET